MDSFRYIWQYVKRHKLRYFFAIVLVILSSALFLVNPYLSKLIVDEIIMPRNYNFPLLLKYLGLMALIVLAKNFFRYIYVYSFESVSQSALQRLRTDAYSKIQQLDFEYFDKTKTGDIMSKMTGDLDIIRHFIAWVLFSSIEQTSVFTFGISVFFAIDWRLALLQLSIVPLLFFYANGLVSHARPAFVNIRKHFSKLNTVAQENISGNRVVKAFAKEDFEIKKFTEVNEGFYQAQIKSSKVGEKYLPPITTLGGMYWVILIFVGSLMVITDNMTMGELVLANGLVWTLANPIHMAGWLISDWQRFSTSVSKLCELMHAEPKIHTNTDAVAKKSFSGKVEFDRVYFRYGEQATLRNITFTAYPGQTVAIIGPTGSGKSTLVNLICRFYDVTGGSVKIDDIDVRKIDIRRLRENVAMAQQDIFLFSDTIEGNIAYGVPDAKIEDVVRVAKIADADGFIRELPEGYDTIVGERGVGLSGGQKQRIALARALLKNPSVLVLDDTTSSVDIETEYEIQQTLRRYYTDKTTFIIAHRISSVKNANLILVLDDGMIVERGTHDELIALGGQYYHVFENQYGDFNKAGGDM